MSRYQPRQATFGLVMYMRRRMRPIFDGLLDGRLSLPGVTLNEGTRRKIRRHQGDMPW